MEKLSNERRVYESVDDKKKLFEYISKIDGKQNSFMQQKVNIDWNLELFPSNILVVNWREWGQ